MRAEQIADAFLRRLLLCLAIASLSFGSLYDIHIRVNTAHAISIDLVCTWWELGGRLMLAIGLTIRGRGSLFVEKAGFC